MNLPNAVGFILLGTVMHVAPEMAPWLVRTAHMQGGNNASLLWLQFMSWLLRGIGGAYSLKFVFSLSWAVAETRILTYRRRVAAEPAGESEPVVVGVSA